MSTALTIGTHAVRCDDAMWCITDMWRASGGPKEKRPNDFLSGPGKAFAEFLSDSVDTAKSGIVKTRRIGGATPGGETWAHWQLALAYAKWISHDFHARVNEVYRAFTAGQFVTRDAEPSPATAQIQARIGDDMRAKGLLLGWLQMACTHTGRSMQSIQGELRKAWGLASVYRIALASLDRTISDIQTIMRDYTSRKRLAPAASRQTSIPFSKAN